MKKKSFEVLGTVFEISLPSSFSNLFTECFDELNRIEKKFSRFDTRSTLSFLNSNINKKQSIDSEFYFILEKGLEYYHFTEHYFDISQKKILESLGYNSFYSFRKNHILYFL